MYSGQRIVRNLRLLGERRKLGEEPNRAVVSHGYRRTPVSVLKRVICRSAPADFLKPMYARRRTRVDNVRVAFIEISSDVCGEGADDRGRQLPARFSDILTRTVFEWWSDAECLHTIPDLT